MQKAIHFVNNPEEIRLLANFIHREILQLLSEREMTQTELSHSLSLTKSAIGYHLKQLLQAHLIYIKNVEAESHGILQKFYSPISNFILASYDQTPKEIKRYFIQIQIEHLIGMLAAMQIDQAHFVDINAEALEELATLLWKQLEASCKKYREAKVSANGDGLKIAIYADALKNISTLPEWKALLSLS